MKYLRKFNESIDDDFGKSIEQTINDVCLELSDLGFYSDRNGRNLGSVIIQPAHGYAFDKSSYVGISKNVPFHFDEIKDCVYRLKDIVGMDKIGTFNYHLTEGIEYTRCDMNKLQNETLDIGILKGAFITFNFPIKNLKSFNEAVKSNAEDFIKRAKSIHGDKYDYSKVVYNGSKKNVIIGCPKHGEFPQMPNAHLNGQGCRKCGTEKVGNNQRSNIDTFINKAKLVHGDKYDYSKVVYGSSNQGVIIICKKHNKKFIQTPNSHLRGSGCPECGIALNHDKQKSTTEDFIKKSKIVHGDKYDYSKVNYTGNRNKVIIICKKHNKEFTQVPTSHLNGRGCPTCQESQGERTVASCLDKLNIKFERQHKFDDCRGSLRPLPFDFYLPNNNTCIEYDGIQHFEPVDRFGGEEGLRTVQQLDYIKTKYCKTNNIKLIRIRYYDTKYEDILDLIKKSLGI